MMIERVLRMRLGAFGGDSSEIRVAAKKENGAVEVSICVDGREQSMPMDVAEKLAALLDQVLGEAESL